MYHITMTDLIETLRKAASNPEAHSPAQQEYFSDIQENSVLVNCGTACCAAGDLMLKAYAGNQASDAEIAKIIHSNTIRPDIWVRAMLGLTQVEEALAFECNTHYEIHLLLADLLEAGLRLNAPGMVEFPSDATYTEFRWLYLDDTDVFLNLQETLDWMRAISE